jgi:rhamnosyltransferase
MMTVAAAAASPRARDATASPPRVLVLLASYNGARWIRQQLESILAQDGVDAHITIRDDGSSDSTLQEIAGLAADGRIELASASPPTGSAAGNFFTLIGQYAADGFDFVAFSDQDDIWRQQKLAHACRLLQDTGSAAYSSATIAQWEDGRQRLVALSGRQNTCDFLFEGGGQGCTFVLSASFYERVRRFIAEHPALTQGLHFHDWTVYALARAWGLRWAFDSRPTVVYRQHSGNDTGARGSFPGARKRLALLRNGWYRGQLERISLLCAAAAPDDVRIAAWRRTLAAPRGWKRTARLVRFCLHWGRRRTRDRAVFTLACLAGWV